MKEEREVNMDNNANSLNKNNNELAEEFLKFSREIGITLNKDDINKFFSYMCLLKEWNEKMNLTAIVDDNEIILKHFVDSLTVMPYIHQYVLEVNMKKQKQKVSIADIGTGAGFPGIPISICQKHIQVAELEVTLVDSLEKRVNFLNEVIKQLQLNNIEAVHSRAEDMGLNPQYREKFDIAVARAVAALPVLLEYCLPFVKTGGIFIAMKGSNAEGEVAQSAKALDILGGKIEKIAQKILPSTDMKRNIIIIRKLRHCPTKYPRKAGKPSKQPLI